MNKKLLCTAVGGALALGTCLFGTSCIGPNNAFEQVHTWNSKLSDSKFVNELAFLGLGALLVRDGAAPDASGAANGDNGKPDERGRARGVLVGHGLHELADRGLRGSGLLHELRAAIAGLR